MKNLKIILTSVTFFVTTVFRPTNVISIEINLKEHNGISAAVRSLLLPGWGQYYNEQKQKTYVIATAVSILCLSGFYFYTDAEQIYKKYEEKGLKNDPLYDEYEQKITAANILFILTGLAWGYSVIDAYIYGEKYKARYGFNIDLLKNKILVKFTYRF